jgi:hypothetical protein
MRLREKRSLLALPIEYSMLLQNLLHYRGLTGQPARDNDLFVGILWI